MKPSLALLLAAPLLAPLASASDVLVVDPGQAGAFATIADAVAVAAEGDVVLVRAGTYPESVTIDGLGITVVGDGAVRIDGAIEVRSVAAGQAVLLGGLEVVGVQGQQRPAVEIEDCDGPVRVVDCDLTGSADQISTGTILGGTGAGADVSDSRDVAFVDSRMNGGAGSIYAGALFFYVGASGIDATRVDRLSIIRCVCRGAEGSGDIFGTGGDGGDGAHLDDCGGAWIAYSAFFGGQGGIGDATSTAISGDGGTGFHADGTGTVWDFQGVFHGGVEGCQFGSFCNPGQPGDPTGGTAPVRALDGFPSRLNAPLLVRAGQSYTPQIVSVPGDGARLAVSASTAFGFRPGAKQPRLVARPTPVTAAPLGVVPTSSRLDLPLVARPIPGGADAFVVWAQATLDDGTAPTRLSSPRPIVFLDPAF